MKLWGWESLPARLTLKSNHRAGIFHCGEFLQKACQVTVRRGLPTPPPATEPDMKVSR
jgi:hypothetical protein